MNEQPQQQQQQQQQADIMSESMAVPPPTQPSTHTHDVLLYIIAIFIPPVAVYFKRQCHADLWINIALWILGWIPGVLHAWWIISKY